MHQTIWEGGPNVARERERRQVLLWCVAPDGTRVFKTEDGTQVFDEFGEEVYFDELDPAQIPNGNPWAETYLQKFDLQNQLEAEQTQILEFQDKLDSARNSASQDDFTTDELKELDAELADLLPASVAEQMSDLGAKEIVPVPQAGLEITNIPNKLPNPIAVAATVAPKMNPMG